MEERVGVRRFVHSTRLPLTPTLSPSDGAREKRPGDAVPTNNFGLRAVKPASTLILRKSSAFICAICGSTPLRNSGSGREADASHVVRFAVSHQKGAVRVRINPVRPR